MIAETVALILRIEGYKAQFFVNPFEALKAAEAAAPDLLISDVMMPQLNGVKLAIRFSQNWPRCRILLFSGNAGTLDLLKDARLEGFDFTLVGKPLHPSNLMDHIRKLE